MRHSIDLTPDPVISITLLADERTLLVGTLDSTIRLMDQMTGELLQTFKGHSNDKYRSHAAITHGDATVLAGGEDGRVHAFEVESGASRFTIQAHKKLVTWTEGHPKLTDVFLTAGADGAVKLWGPRNAAQQFAA